MAFEILNVDQLISRLKGRKYKYSQVHHTWKPNHADFNGSNHMQLQQGMKNYHVNNRGWSDIGQHVTLMPDGLFVTGRPFNQTPAGISGYNTGSFMVEMLGDFDLGRDRLEGAQLDSMLKLQHFLVTECGAAIMFHREHASKSCPGTGIDKGWFIQAVASYGQSKPDHAPIQQAPKPQPVKVPELPPIEKFQNWLNARYGAGLAVDGIFGPKTKKASIKAYQREIGVIADGVFGPKSKAAAESIRLHAEGPLVWVAQGMLTGLGFNTQGVDGVFGTNTASATIRFQTAKKLLQDGIIGKNTWEALFR